MTQQFKRESILSLDGQHYGIRLVGGDAVGGTSFIYEAYRWDVQRDQPQGRELILKRFAPMSRGLWELERDVLQGVAAYDGQGDQQHFPRAISSGEQHIGGQPSYLLLMEHAGTRHIGDLAPIDDAEALRVMAHYLSTITTLTRLGFTCWDRKLKDLFWQSPDRLDYPQGKLLVIDWNMAERWTPERLSGDLIQAGRLGYEMLTGIPALKRPGSDSYDLDHELSPNQMDDPNDQRHVRPWANVCFGTQAVVQELLSGARDLLQGALSASFLKEQLIDRLEQLRERCLYQATLWDKDVTPLMEQADQYLHQQRWAQALVCTSIAMYKEYMRAVDWRKTQFRFPKHQHIHAAALSNTDAERDILAAPRRDLAEGRFAEALAYLQHLLTGGANLTLEQELAAQRWLLLTNALSVQDDVRSSFRAVRSLESLEEALAQLDFAKALPICDAIPEIGTLFRAEASVRQKVSVAAVAMQKSEYAEAVDNYQQAQLMLSIAPLKGEPAERYWRLVAESLSDMETLAVVAGRRFVEREIPSKKLKEVELAVSMFSFVDAIALLDEGLVANPHRLDLARTRAYVKRLAMLGHLVSCTSGTTAMLYHVLPLLADDSLSEAYRRYPQQLLNDFKSTIEQTLFQLKAQDYPSTVAEIRDLMQRVNDLPPIFRLLKEYKQLPPSWEGIVYTEEYVSQLNQHAQIVTSIDRLVTGQGGRLSPEQRQLLLDLAIRFKLNTFSDNTVAAIELARIEQVLIARSLQKQQSLLDTLVATIKDHLLQQNTPENTKSFLDQAISDVETLDAPEIQMVAKKLQHWLLNAYAVLPRQMIENHRLVEQMDYVLRQNVAHIGGFVKNTIDSLRSIQENIDALILQWPGDLGQAPNLTSLVFEHWIDQVWQDRATHLVRQLPKPPIHIKNQSSYIHLEIIIEGLQECYRNVKYIQLPWINDLLDTINLYENHLSESHSYMFILDIKSVDVNKEVGVILADRAKKIYKEYPIAALGLILFAFNLSKTNMTEDMMEFTKIQDEIIKSIEGGGELKINSDIEYIYEQSLNKFLENNNYGIDLERILIKKQEDQLNNIYTHMSKQIDEKILRFLNHDQIIAEIKDSVFRYTNEEYMEIIVRRLDVLTDGNEHLSENMVFELIILLVLMPNEIKIRRINELKRKVIDFGKSRAIDHVIGANYIYHSIMQLIELRGED